MLLEHERDYGLGMDAMVTVCSWSTNAIMVWAWMQCTGYRMLLEQLGMDALLIALTCTRTELWFGHGCKGNRMLLEHELDYGLGMDAKETVCSWNTNEIMVWAWMQ